jgi:hypothetical protein
MLISIFLACCAFAAFAPAAAPAADLPLPVSAQAVPNEVDQAQRDMPDVRVPEVPVSAAPERAVRETVAAVPKAVARVREAPKAVQQPATAPDEIAAPGRSSVAQKPRPAGQRTHGASSNTHARPKKAHDRRASSTAPHARAHAGSPATVKHAASTDHRTASQDRAPSELPGVSAAATTGIALGGGLLAVLFAAAVAAWPIRRPLTCALRAPPRVTLCSAIERPG